MSGAEAIHPFDMRVPAGLPLLASWWWRALIAGVTLGLVPLVCVLWGFIDTPMGAWMESHWPTLTQRGRGQIRRGAGQQQRRR